MNSTQRRNALLELERLSRIILEIAKALETDSEIGDYCWNFEEAAEQIAGTLATIRRQLPSVLVGNEKV